MSEPKHRIRLARDGANMLSTSEFIRTLSDGTQDHEELRSILSIAKSKLIQISELNSRDSKLDFSELLNLTK